VYGVFPDHAPASLKPEILSQNHQIFALSSPPFRAGRKARLRKLVLRKDGENSYMKRTVSIKLAPTPEQAQALLELQAAFAKACNGVVPFARDNRCWNRVALHHLAYYPVREATGLGSQMVCNALKAVADAYKVLKLKKPDEVPVINFRATGSVHFDARTYAIKEDSVSLYSLTGRQIVKMALGNSHLPTSPWARQKKRSSFARVISGFLISSWICLIPLLSMVMVFLGWIWEKTTSLRPPAGRFLEEVCLGTFVIGTWRCGVVFSPTAANRQGNC
jgi:hypothetical protein